MFLKEVAQNHRNNFNEAISIHELSSELASYLHELTLASDTRPLAVNVLIASAYELYYIDCSGYRRQTRAICGNQELLMNHNMNSRDHNNDNHDIEESKKKHGKEKMHPTVKKIYDLNYPNESCDRMQKALFDLLNTHNPTIRAVSGSSSDRQALQMAAIRVKLQQIEADENHQEIPEVREIKDEDQALSSFSYY